jgi:hypothetical protein
MNDFTHGHPRRVQLLEALNHAQNPVVVSEMERIRRGSSRAGKEQ